MPPPPGLAAPAACEALSAGPHGVLVSPCAPDTAEYGSAQGLLFAFRAYVERLPAGGDPRPANQALCALLAHRCFAVALALLDEVPHATSNASMRAFWSGGGQDWLYHMLSLRVPRGMTLLSIPPTILPTLATDVTPGHPLAPLLCPSGDAACGAGTRGWLLRADRALARLAHDPLEDQHAGTGLDPRSSRSSTICEDRAAHDPRGSRLDTWYQCQTEIRLREFLPLGAFREPDHGWLVVHRASLGDDCSELGAYDLATGSAYLVRGCQDAPTGARRGPRGGDAVDAMGLVSVVALREAALLTMLSGEATRGVPSELGLQLPDRVEREARDRTRIRVDPPRGLPDQTMGWLWTLDGRTQASGDLAPMDRPDVMTHAGELLDVATADLREGCPAAPMPAGLPSPSNPLSDLAALDREQADALAGLRRRAVACTAANAAARR